MGRKETNMEEIQNTRVELLKQLGTFLRENMYVITNESQQKGYIEALKLYLDATDEGW